MISRPEKLVTVFGGGGFIGRYVCEFLLKSDVRVRVAQRDTRSAHIIQPLGQVGQFGFVRADLTDAESVRRAVHGFVELPLGVVLRFAGWCHRRLTSMGTGSVAWTERDTNELEEAWHALRRDALDRPTTRAHIVRY